MGKVPRSFSQSAVVEVHNKGIHYILKNDFPVSLRLGFWKRLLDSVFQAAIWGPLWESVFLSGLFYFGGHSSSQTLSAPLGRHRTTRGGINPGKVTLGSLPSLALGSSQAKRNVVGGLAGWKETTPSVWGRVSGEAGRHGPGAFARKILTLWWCLNHSGTCAFGFCCVLSPWSLGNFSIINLILELNALVWAKLVLL